MKKFVVFAILLVLIVGCKHKRETVREVPGHLRTDLNSNFEKENDNAKINVEIEAVERIEKVEIEEVSEELDDGEKVYVNEILNGIDEVDPWDYRQLPIKTQNDVDALIAFEDFLPKQKYSLDRFNTLRFIDIDKDGIEETLMEYSVILDIFSGSNTWSLQFLVGRLQNKKITPIIHETLGGKGYRTVSFEKIDVTGNFIFRTVSYAEEDAMCCPTINGESVYSFRQGEFVEIKK